MKEGDIVLAPFPQADGQIKKRPALVLRLHQNLCFMPPLLPASGVHLDTVLGFYFLSI
jgi:hypothetical protein